MLGNKFCWDIRRTGEPRFESVGDPLMQPLARPAQQCVIGGTLHEGVLDWYSAAGGTPRWKTKPAATRRSSPWRTAAPLPGAAAIASS
jgi:hypothetical protein